MLFELSDITTNVLDDDLFLQKLISVSVLRLDKIHPIVSGNKIFKLHYFLKAAGSSGHKTILSFGGAWSNHLVATAFAGRASGLKTIGIIRGEEPGSLSSALQQCLQYGMKLKFISRESYAAKDDPVFLRALQKEFGEFILIPEGGYDPLGAKGAALITGLLQNNNYTHICTAAGTATTLAGLLLSAKPGQVVTGVSVLKGETDMHERIRFLTDNKANNIIQLKMLTGYHFGGYARKTKELIGFMNQCWQKYHLPLDFVYTAKMLYAVIEEIKKDDFPAGSRILCLHTGGLQGNRSLPVDTLLY